MRSAALVQSASSAAAPDMARRSQACPAPRADRSRVLVACGEEARRRAWAGLLEDHGLEPLEVRTVTEAIEQLTRYSVDVVLADVDLPGDGAHELARRLYGIDPAVLLLGRADLADRVVAVEMGAHDLLPREIDGRELVARVRAVARGRAPGEPRVRAAGWRARPALRTLQAPNGRAVALSQIHWQVLMLLVGNEGRPVDARMAAEAIPSFRDNPDGALRTAVSRLRRRLMEEIGCAPISSYYGAGYVLDVPVMVSANDG